MKNKLLMALLCLVFFAGCSETRTPTHQRNGLTPQKICPDVQGDFRCAQSVEKEFLKIYKDIAIRPSAHELTLQFDSVKSITLKDVLSENYETAISYNLIDYLDSLDFYVVRLQYYEGSGFMLVSKKDGKQYPVSGLPILSPDGKAFVCIDRDLAAEYNANSIQVWHTIEGKLVIAYELNPKKWGPSGAVWKDADHISIDRVKYDDNIFKEIKLSSQMLSLQGGRWTLK